MFKFPWSKPFGYGPTTAGIPAWKYRVKINRFETPWGHVMLLVPVSIGTKISYFLLDTGSQRTIIDDMAARKWQLGSEGEGPPVFGAGGVEISSSKIHLESLEIAGAPQIKGFPALIADVNRDNVLWFGVLGMDFLDLFESFTIGNSTLYLGEQKNK